MFEEPPCVQLKTSSADVSAPSSYVSSVVHFIQGQRPFRVCSSQDGKKGQESFLRFQVQTRPRRVYVSRVLPPFSFQVRVWSSRRHRHPRQFGLNCLVIPSYSSLRKKAESRIYDRFFDLSHKSGSLLPARSLPQGLRPAHVSSVDPLAIHAPPDPVLITGLYPLQCIYLLLISFHFCRGNGSGGRVRGRVFSADVLAVWALAVSASSAPLSLGSPSPSRTHWSCFD